MNPNMSSLSFDDGRLQPTLYLILDLHSISIMKLYTRNPLLTKYEEIKINPLLILGLRGWTDQDRLLSDPVYYSSHPFMSNLHIQ